MREFELGDPVFSMAAARTAAGLLPPVHALRYGREKLISELQVLTAQLGRAPKTREIDREAKKGNCGYYECYRREFGTMARALEAAGLTGSGHADKQPVNKPKRRDGKQER